MVQRVRPVALSLVALLAAGAVGCARDLMTFEITLDPADAIDGASIDHLDVGLDIAGEDLSRGFDLQGELADGATAFGLHLGDRSGAGSIVVAALRGDELVASSDVVPFEAEAGATVTVVLSRGGSDGGVDAGADAGFDAGSDAGADGGADAGADGGSPDAGSDSGSDSGAGPGTDSGTDSGCTPGPFGTPVNVGEVNSMNRDGDPALSPDGRTLYLMSARNPTPVGENIWVATRASPAVAFGTPALVDVVNTDFDEGGPWIAADGLTLYLDSDGMSSGTPDVCIATRGSLSTSFTVPVVVPGVNSSYRDESPSLTPDGLTLFFGSARPIGAPAEIWTATRASTSVGFDTPVLVDVVNDASYEDTSPEITADGLTLFFASNRSGGLGGLDIWMAIRPDVASPFAPPVQPLNVNSASADDADPSISSDGRTLFFSSDRSGGLGLEDIWVSTAACL